MLDALYLSICVLLPVRTRSTDGRDFFHPSCLENPWKHLEAPQPTDMEQQQQQQWAAPQATSRMIPMQAQHAFNKHVSRPGRVLFQPSFLADPWAA